MYQLWIRRNDTVENPERPWVMIDRRNGRDTYVYYANTDWYHYLYRDTQPVMSHNISFSGGTKKVKYFLSGGYNREEGMLRTDTDVFRKVNFRSRLSFDVNDWINISNNTSFYHSLLYVSRSIRSKLVVCISARACPLPVILRRIRTGQAYI